MFKNIKFNNIEKEILILKAVIDIIDSAVNHSILKFFPTEQGFIEVRFKDYTEQYFFNILLVDLISTPAKELLDINDNYIDYLSKCLEYPNFNNENSVNALKNSIYDFKNWLETEIVINKMWFPVIEKELDFKIKRKNIIKICGNKCKHNFTRLNQIAKVLNKDFKYNGIILSDTEAILVIDDFYNWFHGDGAIFSYYSNILAEMLNNIRWGIQNYLQVEFYRSYTINKKDERRYLYKYPQNVTNPLAKNYYWDLMNEIRGGCIFEKFIVPDCMKKYY